MENLIIKNSFITKKLNVSDIKNISSESVDSPLLSEEMAEDQALEKKENIIFSMPPDLMEKFLKMLPPNYWFSFLLTCKAASLYADSYWRPLFKNKEEARDFLKPNYHKDDLDCSCCGFTESLEILRTVVHQHLNQEINISKRIYIPAVAKLLNNIYGIKEEPQTLIDCGLLKKEDFKEVDLKPAHIAHLFSHGVIFHLICCESIDLKALSNVPGKHVQEGILNALISISREYDKQGKLKKLSNILDEYIEGKSSQAIFDEKKEIIINMLQSNLFINIADGMNYRTPLHMAVDIPWRDLVATLLKLGAQASLKMKDCNSQTPLDLAKEMLSFAKKQANNVRDIEEYEKIIQILQNAAEEALA